MTCIISGKKTDVLGSKLYTDQKDKAFKHFKNKELEVDYERKLSEPC